MKDVSGFSRKTGEHVTFEVIVFAFTDKTKVIRLLEKTKKTEIPKGVMFSVRNGKDTLSDGTDEVLFEIFSEFVVERVKEVAEEKYVIVRLLFVSPSSQSEAANL